GVALPEDVGTAPGVAEDSHVALGSCLLPCVEPCAAGGGAERDEDGEEGRDRGQEGLERVGRAWCRHAGRILLEPHLSAILRDRREVRMDFAIRPEIQAL